VLRRSIETPQRRTSELIQVSDLGISRQVSSVLCVDHQRIYLWSCASEVIALFLETETAHAQRSTDKRAVPYFHHSWSVAFGNDAKTLAQSTLRMSGKNIVTSDRAIELRTFLNRHGRSTPDEAQPIYSLLRRYLAAKDLYCCKTNLGPSKQELISGWPKHRFKSDRFRRAIPELRFNENRISNQVGSVDHPQYRCHGSVL
jgi:hypothetical protein